MKLSRVDLEYIAKEILNIPQTALNAELSNKIEAITTKQKAIIFGKPENAIAATQEFVITPDETPVLANRDVITVGGIDYTLVENLSIPTKDYEVLVGENDTETLSNLVFAINQGLNSEHSEYYDIIHTSLFSNPLVMATESDAITLTVKSLVKGEAGNEIECSAVIASGGADWGDTNLVGGIDGTVGEAKDMRIELGETNYLWVCTSANTITDSNWIKIG